MNTENELGQFIPLHYHYQMLSDKNRMHAFETAIAEVVLPSHRVVELGSGTGILSYLAAKKGAKVTGIEYNPELVSHSRKFMDTNEVADQVEIIHADAMKWMPEEPADVVICEMLHSALLREKQTEVISKFRNEHFKRFKKTPIFLPTATLLAAQPVLQSYDFAGFKVAIPLFNDAYIQSGDLTESCDPMVYKMVDYNVTEMDPITGDVTFEFNKNTQVNALRFITKSILSMSTTSLETIDWHNHHLILPLKNEINMKPGQKIRARFNYNPGDSIEKLHESIKINVITNRVIKTLEPKANSDSSKRPLNTPL
jgi:protein arginine N-methyltransferase 1